MDSSLPELGLVICQLLVFGMVALVIGTWLIVAGLRVLRDPARVKEKSLINQSIRWSANHGPFASGSIRFWACMAFLAGVGMDLIAALILVVLVGRVVQVILSP